MSDPQMTDSEILRSLRQSATDSARKFRKANVRIAELEGELAAAKADLKDSLKVVSETSRMLIQSDDALFSAKAELANRDWRPISEAPKDGTEVLVVTEDGEIQIASFQEEWRSIPGWYVIYNLTHFMSLPQPPTP